MKPPTACRQCRIAKRRCTRPSWADCCAQCRRRDLRCGATSSTRQVLAHPPLQRTVSGHNPSDTLVTSDACPVVDDEETRKAIVGRLSSHLLVELAEVYLDKVHGCAHSIFHPPTVRLQLRNGQLTRPVLYAMSSIGSKFSEEAEHRQLGIPLSKEAQRLLQADLENTCLENIQACLLCAMLCGGNCNVSSEALFIRIAINMAEFMKLDSVASDDRPVSVRETARRVAWDLFLAHHRCFSGLGIEGSSYHPPPKVDLPMDDVVFASLEADRMRLESPSKPGLWAHMMTLVELSQSPIELNRRIAQRAIEPDELDRTVAKIQRELEGWLERIPTDAHMNIQNLYRQQQNGFGGLFVVLHLTYHYYSILLYFSFLERREVPPSICCTYITRCKNHASSFSSLLHLSRQLDGCSVSYPRLGHMITVCSAVLVHTLLLGDAGEITDARRDLNANFQALVDLLQHWPATSAVIGRLMKFQDACLLSTESHRLDGWLVGFLLDHSVSLEERNMTTTTTTTTDIPTQQNIEIVVGEQPSSLKTKELRESGRYTDFNSIQDKRDQIRGVGGRA